MEAQREAIVQLLEEVDGIKKSGIVYEYQKVANSWDAFIANFTTAQHKIHAWCVTRVSTNEVCHTNNETMRYYQWVIRGYLGLEDSKKSELAIQRTIENICKKFRQNINLLETARPGNDDNYNDIGIIQVTLIESRMFGSVLVHYVELGYRSKELNNDISLKE
ncbi:MAG TPA: hypothetical protein VMV56_07610 [Williamwhitmania sp.]|nr:hypothetical protein [Williamwhitmania sp.]